MLPSRRTPNPAGCTPPQAYLSEGLRPSDSPTRSLASRFVGSLRSRGLTRTLVRLLPYILKSGYLALIQPKKWPWDGHFGADRDGSAA